MKRVGIGIIGAGFISDTHARVLRDLRDLAEIRGVFSRSLEKTKFFAEKHGIPKVYSSLSELLSDDSVDAVVIATPNYTHKSIAVECAKSGKNIFLEKPIALSVEEGREIIEEAERNSVKLFIGHVLRFWPEYVKIREIVLSGGVGEPRVARVYRLASFPKWTYWHKYMAYSGGVTVDLAIHDIDYLRWVLGPVSKVYAVGGVYSRHSVDAIDHVMYLLEFENGSIAYGEASWAMPDSFPFTTYLEIAGTKGLATVDNRSTRTLWVYTESRVSEEAPLHRDAYYLQMRSFLRWLLFNEPIPIDPWDALESLRVAIAINESVRRREIVSLRGG
ncbi:MAG: Gfo/Idh/MocA family oxidoreductase [Sulfolobales archaeon]